MSQIGSAGAHYGGGAAHDGRRGPSAVDPGLSVSDIGIRRSMMTRRSEDLTPDQGDVRQNARPRFLALLDELQTEYNGVTSAAGGDVAAVTRSIHDEYQRKINEYDRDLAALDATLFDLANKHTAMKRRYEAEIGQLKNILAYNAGIAPLAQQEGPAASAPNPLMDTVISGSSPAPPALASYILSIAASNEQSRTSPAPYPMGTTEASAYHLPSVQNLPQPLPHPHPQQHLTPPRAPSPRMQPSHHYQQSSQAQSWPYSQPHQQPTMRPQPLPLYSHHHPNLPSPPAQQVQPSQPTQPPQLSPRLQRQEQEYHESHMYSARPVPPSGYSVDSSKQHSLQPVDSIPSEPEGASDRKMVSVSAPLHERVTSNQHLSTASTPAGLASDRTRYSTGMRTGFTRESEGPRMDRGKISHETSTTWPSSPTTNGHAASEIGATPLSNAGLRDPSNRLHQHGADDDTDGEGRADPMSVSVQASGEASVDQRALVDRNVKAVPPPSAPGVVTTFVAPNAAEMTSTRQGITDQELDFLVFDGKDSTGSIAEMDCTLLYTMQHDSVVCCVKYSPDGRFLATGSNRAAHIFDQDSGKHLAVLSKDRDSRKRREGANRSRSNGRDADYSLSHLPESSSGRSDTYVRAVCFSPDCDFLVTGAEDHMVKIWDIEAATVRHKLVGHETDIYSVDVSKNGRFVVSGSGDKRAKLWNMETGKQMMTLGGEYGPMDGITSVCVSPSSRHVAAGSLDKVVRIWDVETGKLKRQFNAHRDSVYSVGFSPDGKTLVSGSLDKTVKLWDLTTEQMNKQCQLTFSGHRDFVLSVVYSPDGQWLISGSKDRTIQWWDPRQDSMSLMVQGHRNSVISVDHNPRYPRVVSGSGDRRARGWIYNI